MASQQTDTQMNNDTKTELSLTEKVEIEIKKIDECMKICRTTLSSFKSLKNEISKMEKRLQKELRKRKKRTSESSENTGFKAYRPISKRLSLFSRDHLVEVMESKMKECEKSLKNPDSLTNKQLEDCTKNIERYPKWLKDVESFKYENDWENEWPRTAITTVLSAYVEYHSLKDPKARSYIMVEKPAGKNLRKILDDFSDGDKLKYMNIQTYIRLNILTNARKKELENFQKNGSDSSNKKTTTTTDDAKKTTEKVSETPSSKIKKPVKKKKVKSTKTKKAATAKA